MAKKKKGFQEYKKFKTIQQNNMMDTLEVDDKPNLQKLAKEFSKLLKKKYCFILSDGNYVEFQIKQENFYHLLGFNKFENMVYNKMIEDITVDYWKCNFYEDVLNGYITYEGYDSNKIYISEELKKISDISFAEHKEISMVKEVKFRRFPYFTYDKIIELFKSKVVIDYEKEKNNSLINADKIFFKFIDELQRNLNLFIGYNKEEKNFFPSTFFLENKKDTYKYQKDGSLMGDLDIICLYIEDLCNNKKVEFYVDWDLVENCVEKVECFETYKELKRYYSSSKITVSNLRIELEEIDSVYRTKIEELDIINKEKKIIELKLKYFVSTSEDKKNCILDLMDYNVDIENEKLSIEKLKKDQSNMLSKQKINMESVARLKRKNKIIIRAIPKINDMAMYKVRLVYRCLINKSDPWNSDFWLFLINEKMCFEKDMEPREVKKLYSEWISKNNN